MAVTNQRIGEAPLRRTTTPNQRVRLLHLSKQKCCCRGIRLRAAA